MKKFVKKHKWPLVIFSAAFLLRLIYLLQYRSNPAFDFPMVDELWHLRWAREIIGGNFWGDEALFRGPLYPYLLAFFLKITGSSLFWTRLLQMIIASFSAVMVYLLGRKLISGKVGIIAGLTYAAYGTMIFYEAMLLIPVIFVLLNLIAAYLMVIYKGRYQPGRWFLAGIVLGLAAIARPNILLLAPFFLVWIYLGFLDLKNIRRRFLITLVYLAGILIPVFSVTLRNYVVTGEPILISSQGGVNLYIGNNPDTEGLTMLMPELRLDESLAWDDFTAATREVAEAEAGRKLTAAEESSFWTKKALKFIWQNPATFLAITLKKTVYFLVGFENSDQTDIYHSRTYSSLFSILLWKKLICFPFGLIFPLAVVGMAVCWPKRKELALFYVFIIGYIPTVVLFLVTARHRLPVIPFILIFAAAGVPALWQLIKKGAWKTAWKYLALLAVLLILSNRTYFDIGFENVFQTHFNLGLTYERRGDLSAAEKEYRKALENNPNSATTINNLGYILYRQGRYEEALSQFRKAINIDPDYAEAYNNIGLILESQSDYTNAETLYRQALSKNPGLFQALINLGDIYLDQDRFPESEKAYLDALETAPDNKNIFFKLGALYARMSRFAEAEEMFIKGRQLGEPGAVDLVNWGNIYFSTDQPQRAIERYQRAIAADSSFSQAYYNLAVTFRRFGYPSNSARTYLETLLRLNPGFAPARELLMKLDGK
ncbi:MAG: tetratricopeptide repeat protein [Candidatus Zixiibacteriota bacterium]|nr:MAG: tetratricopeptide repeat protein [candidate division Zixibacteria bacterium]